jgi:hypothetical protein
MGARRTGKTGAVVADGLSRSTFAVAPDTPHVMMHLTWMLSLMMPMRGGLRGMERHLKKRCGKAQEG